MRNIILGIFLSTISLQITAQGPFNKYNPKTFEIVKYKGTIGKHPITMILTFFPDGKTSGYYFYDNVGRLMKVVKSSEKSNVYYARNIEEFIGNIDQYNEWFEFSDSSFYNKKIILGQWFYKDKILPFVLNRDSSMYDWRLIRLKSIGYFKNSYFNTQTKDEYFIYPVVSSSLVLNKYFLKGLSKEMLAFINSSKSKYLLIDQNYGENTDENEDCCWSVDVNTELVFISDSIITYKIKGFTYANNGYEAESYISVKVSNGKQIAINDVFKNNSVDTVFTILKNKYSDVLKENSNENLELVFGKSSDVYLSQGGIYFRERLYKLAPYIDLYFSYKELKPYLKEEFKKTINCP